MPLVLLGIRTASKADLGLAPAEMVYGNSLRLPAELIAPTSDRTNVDPTDFTRVLKAAMRKLRPIQPRLNTRATFVSQRLNDCSHVFVREEGSPGILAPRYSGPHAVLRRTQKTLVIEQNGAEVTVAIDRTKPAFLASDPSATTAPATSPKRIGSIYVCTFAGWCDQFSRQAQAVSVDYLRRCESEISFQGCPDAQED
ncbi:hypothetical protein TTRE_0000974001 [Trichuris trichiura]|uniref:Uncharacterized protein n=1 Tax=Trichuris trichiura TaxID=36087 RepID=A0A077ZLQ1_TRITR|nr:hypothetical protein TTRE_0000974001 [Trichuris trichiura]